MSGRLRGWRWRAVAGVAGVALGAACMASAQRADRAPSSSLRPVAPVPVGPTRAAPVPEPATGCCSCGRRHVCRTRWPSASASLADVRRVTSVNGGLVSMTRSWDADGGIVDQPRPGFAIPLDGMAFDPATFAPFVPATVRPVFEHLRADEVLLGTTSARLRRVHAGATLELAGGRRVTVAGIVDDSVIGAAEVAFTRTGASTELPTPRYLLVTYDGDRTHVEVAIRGTVEAALQVRFRGPGETPFFRQGDAVLAQVFLKERFGEFAFRQGEGKTIIIDPDWERANLVSRNDPILGPLRCNKNLLPALDGRVTRARAAPPRVRGGVLRGMLEPGADRRGRRPVAARVGRGGRHQLCQEPHADRLRAGPAPRRRDDAVGLHLGRALARARPRPLRVPAVAPERVGPA